jgi:hypothetical protein
MGGREKFWVWHRNSYDSGILLYNKFIQYDQQSFAGYAYQSGQDVTILEPFQGTTYVIVGTSQSLLFIYNYGSRQIESTHSFELPGGRFIAGNVWPGTTYFMAVNDTGHIQVWNLALNYKKVLNWP